MDNIDVSPSKGFSNIYNNINTNFVNGNTSPVVLLILTVVIVCYYIIFSYLDVSVPQQTIESRGMSFLELLMWGLIVFLVLINGLQYFFKSVTTIDASERFHQAEKIGLRPLRMLQNLSTSNLAETQDKKVYGNYTVTNVHPTAAYVSNNRKYIGPLDTY